MGKVKSGVYIHTDLCATESIYWGDKILLHSSNYLSDTEDTNQLTLDWSQTFIRNWFSYFNLFNTNYDQSQTVYNKNFPSTRF